MSISGKEYVLILLAEGLESREQGDDLFSQIEDLVFQEEFQIHEHLIVARTSRMDLLADISQSAGQKKLNLRVDVLDVIFKYELTSFYFFQNRIQSFCEDLKFVCCQQSDAFQHLYMSL